MFFVFYRFNKPYLPDLMKVILCQKKEFYPLNFITFKESNF
jgi:hypothetical protein